MNFKGLCLAAVAAFLACAGMARADDDCEGKPGGDAVKLVVETTALRSARGLVTVTVYPDDPRRFLAPHGKFLRSRVKAVLPVTSSCFWAPPGVYAVAIYHDENGDKEFNRTPLGVPTEGFGFSNDAPTRFSLPAFDSVRFRVPAGGRTLRIKMRYP